MLTLSRELADYFEGVVRAGGDPKGASNWVMNEVLRKLNEDGGDLAACRVTPQALAGLLRLVRSGALSGRMAKEVFEEMWLSGEGADLIVARRGLAQVSDEAALRAAVADVLAQHPAQVATYRGGKTSTLGWFVGQVMRRTGGKANPQVLQRLLEQALEG